MRPKLREIAAAATDDPKKALLDSLPIAVKDFECFHNRVLIATYVQPEKTKGGIFLADRSMQEDRFQGKVGLVIAMGPLAFKDDNIAKFGGVTVKAGDWVIYRPSDRQEIFFVDEDGRGATPCGLIEDSLILGRTPDPALVW